MTGLQAASATYAVVVACDMPHVDPALVPHLFDELDQSYPAMPTVSEYRTYQEVCRDIMDRFEVTAWTLYRALWRLSHEI